MHACMVTDIIYFYWELKYIEHSYNYAAMRKYTIKIVIITIIENYSTLLSRVPPNPPSTY